MFKIVLLLSFLFLTAHADKESQLLEHFKAQKYSLVCQRGMNMFYGGHKEEFFTTMVATACAHSDNINPLGLLQARLISSQSARENSTEFVTILLQKRLLYQYMLDDIDLDEYSFAYSSHILSLIFSHLKAKEFTLMSSDPKMIKFSEGDRQIFISISDDKKKSVLVDEYIDGELKERHLYR